MVITNNINVANRMRVYPSIEVVIAGGVVRGSDGGIVGEAAVDFIRQFKVDFAVIGASAIDHDGALLDFDFREVKVAQAIIANARHVILVADSTKIRTHRARCASAMFRRSTRSSPIAATVAAFRSMRSAGENEVELSRSKSGVCSGISFDIRFHFEIISFNSSRYFGICVANVLESRVVTALTQVTTSLSLAAASTAAALRATRWAAAIRSFSPK
jgi:hypothetical protein